MRSAVLLISLLTSCYGHTNQVPSLEGELGNLENNKESDKIKSRKQPSLILFNYNEPNRKLESVLYKIQRELSKFDVVARKVDCNAEERKKTKRKISECGLRITSIYFYKENEGRRLDVDRFPSLSQGVSTVLTTVLLWKSQGMVQVFRRSQLDEILHMNRKLFNVVVGSFRDETSAEHRSFCEVAMEMKANVSFVYASTNIKSKKVREFGYSAVFYHTFYARDGNKLQKDDLTPFLKNPKALTTLVKSLEVMGEARYNKEKLADAKRLKYQQDKEIQKLQKKEMERIAKEKSKVNRLKVQEAETKKERNKKQQNNKSNAKPNTAKNARDEQDIGTLKPATSQKRKPSTTNDDDDDDIDFEKVIKMLPKPQTKESELAAQKADKLQVGTSATQNSENDTEDVSDNDFNDDNEFGFSINTNSLVREATEDERREHVMNQSDEEEIHSFDLIDEHGNIMVETDEETGHMRTPALKNKRSEEEKDDVEDVDVEDQFFQPSGNKNTPNLTANKKTHETKTNNDFKASSADKSNNMGDIVKAQTEGSKTEL